MRALRGRLGRFQQAVPRREAAAVLTIALIAFAIRLAFVLLTTDHTLAGDELEYDVQGRFIADGQWFWSTTPYGNPHPSLWKAPGYPLFVGVLYTVLGTDPDRVFAVQALFGPVTVLLTWVLARRLFGAPAAVLAAVIVAMHPFAWQFETRLYSESIVTPLTLLFLVLLVERPASARRAAGIGVVLGVIVLIRPSALISCRLSRWHGWSRPAGDAVSRSAPSPSRLRRSSSPPGPSATFASPATSFRSRCRTRHFSGSSTTTPPTIRSTRGPGGTRRRATADVFNPERPIPDAELRSILRQRAIDYIREHPLSVPKAFFWNGLSRLWDVRRPAHIVGEAEPTGRKPLPTAIGAAFHYVLLPFALLGLWFSRRRLSLVLPILVMALGASVVFTADGETRYRAPFEPLIALLAGFAAYELLRRWQRSRAGAPPVERPT